MDKSDEVNTSVKSETALREESILKFWIENRVFELSLSKIAPKGEYIFYDGPPFATGLPHYGHLLAGTIKDVIPRYKTMRGYHVPRRWGWDCHGLPLENEIEKELGLKSKRDIEQLGVEVFNSAARAAVLRYADEWKQIVPRFGRWVDMDHDYRTMDATYTESVWWAFKKLHDKGLVYEGYKVMPLCPRCGTTLSNFEVAQGYKDVTDLSVTVKLPVVGQEKTFLLVWTTTPWTLPGNMAVAVNSSAVYLQVMCGDARYIVARDRMLTLGIECTVERELRGSELIGLTYTPPFDYFKNIEFENKHNAWKVYDADFVTMDDGTGLVHIAPAFGAEDLELAQKKKLPIVHHVHKDGTFAPLIELLQGMQAKPKDDPQSTDVAVIKYLAGAELLFKKEKIVHSYPHCWRCDTPLLNYATSSWFVRVSDEKANLVSENKRVSWVPQNVGDKRFGNWLEGARDWAISRARYWGAPIPVWRNSVTKKIVVVGSLADIKKYTKTNRNTFFVMRHGESQNTVQGILSSDLSDTFGLTEVGIVQARSEAKQLKSNGITKIYASPMLRCKETALQVAEVLGIAPELIEFDVRLKELGFGNFSLRPSENFIGEFNTLNFDSKIGGEESFLDAYRRFSEFLYEIEKTNTNERVLIITHGIGVEAFTMLAEHIPHINAMRWLKNRNYPNAKSYKIEFVPVPHNTDYELDLHRPYIDHHHMNDTDGTRLERVPDVFDCWFESGSMAYAQKHYPFENTDSFNPVGGVFKSPVGYPADFIAEGLDQTRGWFYSLLVLGTLLFGKAPFKNVIVNGIVLAEDGQKMSKRLKNYPDPLEVVNKYGADAVRTYLLASPIVRAEDLNFSERGVAEVASKLVNRFLNTLTFYELYKGIHTESEDIPTSPLDRWVLGRLDETIGLVTSAMDAYELDKATKPLFDFLEDVSTWYLRRSRERLKVQGLDGAQAFATLTKIIKTYTKLLAPFAPFVAEHVYQKIRSNTDPISVHLEIWPDQENSIDKGIFSDMEEVRALVTQALDVRQKAGIKVRQPLSELKVKSDTLVGKADLLQIIADEVNVKKVVVDQGLTDTVALDTTITDELKEEGELRDLIREIQDMRKQAGLNPKDQSVLTVPAERQAFVDKHWEVLSKTTGLKANKPGAELSIDKQVHLVL